MLKKNRRFGPGGHPSHATRGELQLGVNCWKKQVVVSLKLETQKIGGTFRTSTDQRSSFRLYQNGVNLADITTNFTKKRYKYALKWPKCF